jgi:hypothetical protein
LFSNTGKEEEMEVELKPIEERVDTTVTLTPQEDLALRRLVTLAISLGLQGVLGDEEYEALKTAVQKFADAEAPNVA